MRTYQASMVSWVRVNKTEFDLPLAPEPAPTYGMCLVRDNDHAHTSDLNLSMHYQSVSCTRTHGPEHILSSTGGEERQPAFTSNMISVTSSRVQYLTIPYCNLWHHSIATRASRVHR